jgi:hypothetical protein
MEDYREQEIENFMEELGVYDNEIDPDNPRWSTPLGSHVHAYLIRQKMAVSHLTLCIFFFNTTLKSIIGSDI